MIINEAVSTAWAPVLADQAEQDETLVAAAIAIVPVAAVTTSWRTAWWALRL